jgi:hypothetical protein
MNRRCPCCQLPVQVLGLTVTASSDDGQRHGVVGICLRCHQAAIGLSQDNRRRRMERAADRALAYPWRYLCTLYPDKDQAILAHALLIHPGHTVAMLGVLGWVDANPAA